MESMSASLPSTADTDTEALARTMIALLVWVSIGGRHDSGYIRIRHPPGMRYLAVAFDFDYTLGDSTEGIMICTGHALASMGLPAPDEEAVRRSIGYPLRDAYRIITGDDDASAAGRFADAFVRKADEAMAETAVLYPQTLPLLGMLRDAGIRTAVVTTKYRRRIEGILDLRGGRDLVDAIVGSDDVPNPKPAPDGLLLAASMLGVSPKDMLYVGDTVVDAAAAEAAGTDFAAVLTGFGAEGRFDPCRTVAVLEDLSGIPGVVGLR